MALVLTDVQRFTCDPACGLGAMEGSIRSIGDWRPGSRPDACAPTTKRCKPTSGTGEQRHSGEKCRANRFSTEIAVTKSSNGGRKGFDDEP